LTGPFCAPPLQIFVDAFWNSKRQSFTAHLVSASLLQVVKASNWLRAMAASISGTFFPVGSDLALEYL
jgi:hypothetical protein